MRSLMAMRSPAFLLLAGLLAIAAVSALRAADPPRPDFFWPYGRVQMGGANLVPSAQPVLALVDGRVCGDSVTKVTVAGPGIPAADAGKTVYVVDVRADGVGTGQQPGCGRIGLPVTLYFPFSHAIADYHPTFQVGALRADVELTQLLGIQRAALQLAADGSN